MRRDDPEDALADIVQDVERAGGEAVAIDPGQNVPGIDDEEVGQQEPPVKHRVEFAQRRRSRLAKMIQDDQGAGDEPENVEPAAARDPGRPAGFCDLDQRQSARVAATGPGVSWW